MRLWGILLVLLVCCVSSQAEAMGLVLTITGEEDRSEQLSRFAQDLYDFDGDGFPDVVTSVNDSVGPIRVRSLNGAILWEYWVPVSEICPACISFWPGLEGFGDLDEAPGRELVLRYYDSDTGIVGCVVISTSSGAILNNFLYGDPGGIADFDGDGRDELLLEYEDDPGPRRIEIWGWYEASVPPADYDGSTSRVYSVSVGPCPSPGAAVLYVRSSIGGSAHVTVHDVTGRLIRDLGNITVKPGHNQATWDGATSGGRQVAPGEYYVNVQLAGNRETCKVVILR
jgi:hypothetical protein